jgi:hypothetical protein
MIVLAMGSSNLLANRRNAVQSQKAGAYSFPEFPVNAQGVVCNTATHTVVRVTFKTGFGLNLLTPYAHHS